MFFILLCFTRTDPGRRSVHGRLRSRRVGAGRAQRPVPVQRWNEDLLCELVRQAAAGQAVDQELCAGGSSKSLKNLRNIWTWVTITETKVLFAGVFILHLVYRVIVEGVGTSFLRAITRDWFFCQGGNYYSKRTEGMPFPKPDVVILHYKNVYNVNAENLNQCNNNKFYWFAKLWLWNYF